MNNFPNQIKHRFSTLNERVIFRQIRSCPIGGETNAAKLSVIISVKGILYQMEET
ncbi:MAG: hypothetical protein R3B55_03820 [Candidatus Paceibacterota bacterium]